MPSSCQSQIYLELKAMLAQVQDPLVQDWDPWRLGLLLSKLEYEDLDIDAAEKSLEEILIAIEPICDTRMALRPLVERLLQYFTQTLTFKGDDVNYYNIRNSFLSDAITRRKGIPITLSLLFMGILRRLGLKCVGIAFPGHFLLRVVPGPGYFESHGSRESVEDWKNLWYLDVFDGRILSIKDCEDRLQEWTRGMLPFGPEVLRVAHPVEIISRMMRNLRAILMEKEDLARLSYVLTTLIELCPQDRLEALRERGLLMARMHRYGDSCKDLKEYLLGAVDPTKAEHARRLLEVFSQKSDWSN